MCREARIVERAGAGDGDSELASCFKIVAAYPADLSDFDSGGMRIECEGFGVEVVTS